jgi:hypothetical protein
MHLYTRSHALMNANISPKIASPKKNIAGSQMIKDIVVTPNRIRTVPKRIRPLTAIANSLVYNRSSLRRPRHEYCK